MAPSATQRLNLVDTLLEMHHTRMNGVLRLESRSVKKQLVVLDGMLALAESNLLEENLARVLVEMEYLTRTDLREITQWMRRGKTTEEALLASKKVDQNILEKGASEQAICILGSLLAWDKCSMRLYPGENLVRRHLNLRISLPLALIMAARRAVAEGWLPAWLRNLEGVVSHAKSGEQSRLHLPLNSIEALAYSRMVEPIEASQLTSLLPPGDDQTEEVFLRLALLGLLQSHDQVATAEGVSISASRQEIRLLETRVEEMLQHCEVSTHYEILGINTEASAVQAREAYHDLAKQFHPDRFQSEEYTSAFRANVARLFTYITGAYTTLVDPGSRASYDESRHRTHSQVEASLQARAVVDLDKERMAEAMFRAARTAITNKDYEKAVSHLKECVWLRPDVEHFSYYLGVAETEVPKLRKQAEEHLLRAIELNPSGMQNHLALGKLYVKVRLPRRAELQFAEVLKWDPNNHEALRQLQQLQS